MKNATKEKHSAPWEYIFGSLTVAWGVRSWTTLPQKKLGAH